jgi:exopolyphosphatase/guanosine-5'-triphosphate,3'-diphosphate pyrophosphatase
VVTPRAVISLGTNTSRLLVIRDDPGGGITQLEHRAIGTRLGEGLAERGPLAEPAMQRTLEAVAAFAAVARSYGATLHSIATSAVRRAQNADEFAARMKAMTGVDLVIVSGGDEAAASYAGATYGHPRDGARVGVLDIGGGSTEIAVGVDGRLEGGVSCEIGSVRLSERFPALMGGAPGEPAEAAGREAYAFALQTLAPFAAFAPVDELRAVAGTATTVAAVAHSRDVEDVRGELLTRSAVAGVLGRLLAADLAARKAFDGMLPQRADIIAGGAIVLLAAMDRLQVSGATVETNDLLLGYLLEQAG